MKHTLQNLILIIISLIVLVATFANTIRGCTKHPIEKLTETELQLIKQQIADSLLQAKESSLQENVNQKETKVKQTVKKHKDIQKQTNYELENITVTDITLEDLSKEYEEYKPYSKN